MVVTVVVVVVGNRVHVAVMVFATLLLGRNPRLDL